MLTLNEKVAITPLGLQFRTDLTFEEWSALAGQIGGALRSMAFVLGDWLVYGEEHFEKQLLLPGFEASACRRISAERYDHAHTATGLDRVILKNYAYVSRRVPLSLRNDILSWEHHRVVAKLQPEDQKRWLGVAATEEDKLSSRRLRVSVARGHVVSVEAMAIPPSERGIANHIPFINRLCAWWNHVGGPDWLKTRTPEQIAAILRDFQPVTDLIASLQTASAISSKGRHQNQTDLPL